MSTPFQGTDEPEPEAPATPDDRYWRTVVEIEIVSDGPPPEPELELEAIAYQIRQGGWSGVILRQDTWPISRNHAAELLKMQGSDPSFLIMDWENPIERPQLSEVAAEYDDDELRMLAAYPTTVREDLLNGIKEQEAEDE